MMSTRWAAPYLTIPYIAGGRGPAGCDCWGLVRLVYQEQRGILLPAYSDVDGEDLRAIARAMLEGCDGRKASPWVAAPAPWRAFDVVLMCGPDRSPGGGRLPVHCGVMVSPRLMLHTEADSAAVIVDLDDATVASRRMGVWRHVG